MSPGKFEGEPWWVYSLWETVLDGCADEETKTYGISMSWFKIDDEIRALTGITGTWIVVYENDAGFVCRRTFYTDDAPQTFGQ